MNNDKKVYVISNSNTRTLDQEMIKRQEEINRKTIRIQRNNYRTKFYLGSS